MIQPNFDLMIWFIFISMGLKGLGAIILGSIKKEKTTEYGADDIIAGLLTLIIFIMILII